MRSRESIRSEKIVMRQQWRDLLFLHWRVPAESIQRLLPDALVVDTFEGAAYVALVPFRMQGITPSRLAPLPGISDLLECNVRTYVRRADGSAPGVWFFSLDASSALAVAVARAQFALPYFYAKMNQRERRVQDETGRWSRIVQYYSLRRHPGAMPGGCEVEYEASGGAIVPAQSGTLEEFLIERYLLYAYRRGRLYSGRVHHSPYQIEAARLLSLRESLVAAAGISRPDDPPLVHYARNVIVEVSPLKAVDFRADRNVSPEILITPPGAA